MTPNADHPQEATIFEESSAESWVDPSDPKSIEEHIMKEEEIKDLKSEIYDLKSDNKNLEEDNKRLEKENKRLYKEMCRFRKELNLRKAGLK